MKRILTELEIYSLAEEHPCRKGSRGWRLLTQESKVWVTKRQEGVKGVSLSLKDTWESAFPSAVFPGNPGWASQQRCPSIKGVSFNTQTLSQSRTVKQAQSFNTHLLLPQASRVAALPSGGFGSLFCAHSLSLSGQAIPSLVLWVPVGSPPCCAQQPLSWENAYELECWGICKAWSSPQVLHQVRWKGNITMDWSPTWDSSWKSISLGPRLQLWSIPFLE